MVDSNQVAIGCGRENGLPFLKHSCVDVVHAANKVTPFPRGQA